MMRAPMRADSTRGRSLRARLLVAGLWLAVGGCGDDDGRLHPPDASNHVLRLNHIQVLGTHNSYHIQPRGRLLTAITRVSTQLAESWEYTHLPLDQQFESQGIRQVELDVFADPAGGRYAQPSGLRLLTGDPDPRLPELEPPGLKVLHVQDLDFQSTCPTFIDCLETIKSWSDAHPGHVPIMILVEAKSEDDLQGLGSTVPLPFGAAEFDALDDEIRQVFPPRHLITPDDVRGEHATLEAAIVTEGWPTLEAARGRVLFALDNGGATRDAYIAGHPALSGRIMFTSSFPGEPEAAFVKLNDPIGDHEAIRALVADGFIVRTRADADTVQARSGDTTQRDAALSSGAHFVSTDYPVANPDFGTGYRVTIPLGTPARCNPVSAPPGCTALAIENPDRLAAR